MLKFRMILGVKLLQKLNFEIKFRKLEQMFDKFIFMCYILFVKISLEF